MKLNVAKVLANEAREKARIKPLPKVKMAGGKGLAPPKPKQQHSEKETLLRNLNQEFHTLQKERAVLSSQNWKLVMAEAEAIQKESPELHEAFMNGNVGRPALAAHYEKIREVHEKMTAVWDNIQFVQANGALPVVAKVQLKVANAPADIQLLQHELNRLKDMVCKTKRKLAGAGGKPAKRAEWNVKVALAEARREEIRTKIKKLNYDARAQRAGEA